MHAPSPHARPISISAALLTAVCLASVTASAGERAKGVTEAVPWSFKPVTRPTLPTVRDATWARDDLDRFILARLDAAGLKPNPGADRPTLIRRAAFALRHYEGQPLAEIGRALGVGEGAVKQAVFRAVQKLRAALAPVAG